MYKNLTFTQLRKQLTDRLINVKNLSRSGARRVVQEMGQSRLVLEAALADLDGQGLFGPAVQSSDEQEKFRREQRQKVPYNFQIERGRLDALRAMSDSDGLSVSHHIRQAVAAYLKAQVKGYRGL